MKNDRSTITSLVTVAILSVVLIILAFTAPMLVRAFIEGFNRPESMFAPVVATFYCILPLAAAVLGCLLKLLLNIVHDNVFIVVNVKLLRAIAILLFAATVVFTVAGFFYMPFFMLAFCAAFMVLIVRVVKNCFAAAVILKDENELTI